MFPASSAFIARPLSFCEFAECVHPVMNEVIKDNGDAEFASGFGIVGSIHEDHQVGWLGRIVLSGNVDAVSALCSRVDLTCTEFS